MRDTKRVYLYLIPAVVVIVFFIITYHWIEPARLFFRVHGIDVSHHQGHIDWRSVSRSGVAFAFIKATEGGDFVDPRFAENWSGSLDAGVLRGAYHFFTLCQPGSVQADNFISVVPKDATALPHAVDAEHMGPCPSGHQVKDVAKEIAVFIKKIEAHYGQRPLIYTGREFHDTYLVGRFPDEDFWIRSLMVPPMFRIKQWAVWQYHNRGRRSGIKGPVDLNVVRTNSRLERMLKTAN